MSGDHRVAKEQWGQETWHRRFRRSSGFQEFKGGKEAMGSRDLVQEFWEVIRILGAQGAFRRPWGQGT